MEGLAGRVTRRLQHGRTALLVAAVGAALAMATAPPATGSSAGALAWGFNGFGELGDGNTMNSDVPVAVSGLTEATEISGGGHHGLALLESGSLMAWGENCCGQLGNGNTTNSDVPVPVGGLGEVAAIAAGGYHSLALLKNGTVMDWGDGSGGQLGNGATMSSGVPVSVSGLSEVTAISAGGFHSLALRQNGTVAAWGENDSGQLGHAGSGDSDVPVPVSGLGEVTAVVGGYWHSLALLRNGTVMAWGDNRYGQLGDGSSTGPETCEYNAEKFPCSRTPVPVSGLSEVTAIAGDNVHSLALLKNGTVMAWGDNRYGQLGIGSFTGPQSCGQPCSRSPLPVSGLSEVRAIAGGGYHSLALLKNGTVMAWGEGLRGQLGNGATANSDMPTTIGELGGVTAIAAGYGDSLAIGVFPTRFPTVMKLEPANGPSTGGTSVTITGTNLGAATAVNFGPAAASSFKVNSESSITAVSPPGTGTVDVTVTTPSLGSPTSATDQFSYTPEPAPTVTRIEPSTGPMRGGTAVQIVGIHFTQATAVNFGFAGAQSYTVNSATSITAVSPSAFGGTVDVTVTNPAGTSTAGAADQFRYYAPTADAKWYKNKVLLSEGETVPILMWGTLTMTAEAGFGGPTTCEYVAGALVDNPQAEGPGIGQTSAYTSYNCVDHECPPGKIIVEGGEYEKERTVVATRLPWSTTLIEEEGNRMESTGVQISIGCVAHGLSNTSPPGGTEIGKPGAQEQFYLAAPTNCIASGIFGTQKPLFVNGKSTTVTSKVEFDAKAGALSCAGGAVKGRTSGKLKVMAYKESEVITAK